MVYQWFPRLRNFVWKWLKNNTIRFEISARVTLGSIVGYTLGVADIPEVVPPTQASFIGWFCPFLITLYPTLIFGVAKYNIPQFISGVFCAGIATLLLLFLATGGAGVMIVGWFFFTLWVGGLRFFRESSHFLALIVLYTMLLLFPLYDDVEEGGIETLASLWTETGTQNEDAWMQNYFIAWGWIICGTIIPHILPPWRTARATIVTEVLPNVLDRNIEYLRLSATVFRDTQEQENQEKQRQLQHPPPRPQLSIHHCDEEGSKNPGEDPRDYLRYTIAAHICGLTDGLATLTAFEPCPQMIRPICSWKILEQLMTDIRRLSLQNLMAIRFFRGPSSAEGFEEVADQLEECKEALIHTLRGHCSEIPVMEDFPGWKSERDPYLLQSKTMNIRKSVQRWGWCMAPPCSSSLSSSHYENVKIGHLKSLKLNISPWLSACFLLYKNLFFDIPMHILSPSSYRRLFAWRTNSDWIRAFYILKFAIGATVLVIMQIYWDAYADFAVPTRDAPGENFAGWQLIGFVITTTHTTEGTVKKGLLRLFGTVVGGFSGWLALTMSMKGDDDYNVYGVVAWLAGTQFIAVLFGLEKSSKARLGLTPDFAYGIQSFVLTQSIICMYAVNGTGSRFDLLANRVVSQVCGIGMAILFAMIPPRMLAGSPNTALIIIDLQEQKILNMLRILSSAAESCSPPHAPTSPSLSPSPLSARSSAPNPLPHCPTSPAPLSSPPTLPISSLPPPILGELNKTNKDLYKKIHTLFQNNAFLLDDAKKLPRFPIFKLDPNLPKVLGKMTVTGAILECISLDLARTILSSPSHLLHFSPGTPLHEWVLDLQTSVETGEEVERKGGGWEDRRELAESPPQKFLILLDHCLARLREHRQEASQVKYGFYWR